MPLQERAQELEGQVVVLLEDALAVHHTENVSHQPLHVHGFGVGPTDDVGEESRRSPERAEQVAVALNRKARWQRNGCRQEPHRTRPVRGLYPLSTAYSLIAKQFGQAVRKSVVYPQCAEKVFATVIQLLKALSYQGFI